MLGRYVLSHISIGRSGVSMSNNQNKGPRIVARPRPSVQNENELKFRLRRRASRRKRTWQSKVGRGKRDLGLGGRRGSASQSRVSMGKFQRVLHYR